MVVWSFCLRETIIWVHKKSCMKLTIASKFFLFLPPGLLVPVEDDHPTLLILGVLLTLRYLIPLLQQQVKDTSLKGSFGVTRKETEISPSPEQLIQVKLMRNN